MDAVQVFEQQGGRFITKPDELTLKLEQIRVFLFDWDGVFNGGYKGEGATSLFSETDSMGTNLMRFGNYLQKGNLPFTAVITGEQNESAIKLARREHFNGVFFKVKNKKFALDYIEEHYGCAPEQVCFFFDDVLDIALAQHVGVRVMINRSSSPLFTNYVIKNKHVDYVTAKSGNQNGLREATEVVMALSGIFDRAVDERIQYSDNYQRYLQERNAQETPLFTQKDNAIVLLDS